MEVEPGDIDRDFSDILSPAIPHLLLQHAGNLLTADSQWDFSLYCPPLMPLLTYLQLFSEPVPCSLLNLSFSKYSPPGDITDV